MSAPENERPDERLVAGVKAMGGLLAEALGA